MPYLGKESDHKIRAYYFITGLFCLCGLLVLSILFYKERIVFVDTALQSVYLMIKGYPCINWVRPGAIIPQIIPLIAIWLHADLKTVLITHSISFVIFFLLMYFAAFWYSRRSLLFFLIPLYLIVITNDSFYWPQSELQQGLIWLCLYAVLLFDDRWSKFFPKTKWFIHVSCMLWVLFFHPLMFFPLLFLVIYYYVHDGLIYSRASVVHILLCFCSFSIRYIVGLYNDYENGKLSLLSLFQDNLPKLTELNSSIEFFKRIPYEYAMYLLMLLLGAIWLIRRKLYAKTFLLGAFTLGYWVLIMIENPHYSRFYIENMLLPLGFSIALVWVIDIFPSSQSTVIAPFLSLCILIRLIWIFHLHADYTDRLTLYEPYISYARHKGLNGVYVDSKSICPQKMPTWASGSESMLISAFNSPDSCTIVQIDDSIEQYNRALNVDTSISIRYRKWHKSEIPERYFKLRGGLYEILKEPL